MAFGNIVVVMFMTYYTYYFLKLLSRKNRKQIREGNKELQKLRKIPVKTIEQQMEFINRKFPKKKKFKWSWKAVPGFLLFIVQFIIIYQIYNFLLLYIGLEVRIWQAILFVMFAPILFNLILEKFDLEKSDLRAYLGWKK